MHPFLPLLIIQVTHSVNEWPSEYPELDVEMIQRELCPWDAPEQCYIFSKDKEITHPILNGMIDCDSRHFEKNNLAVIKGHYGRAMYKYSSCEIQDIFRILCKEPPKDKDELAKYASVSRFYFSKLAISSARTSKPFNQLQTDLANSRLIFEGIGLERGSNPYFEKPPKNLQNYMDFFYKEMYISGSQWNMNRDKTKYENIREILDLWSSDEEKIITEGRQLYGMAFSCDYIGCTAHNPNILYYGQTNENAQFKLSLESSCVKRKHECSQSKFEKKQSAFGTWSPANFAFVEIESAFRIQYANHWIKNEMNPKPIPSEYEPKQPSLKDKQYINKGMEIMKTSVVTPFEWRLNRKHGQLEMSRKYEKFGYLGNPLQNLESKQRVTFNGKYTETVPFQIKGKHASEMQITDNSEPKNKVISPILPPLSKIEITWLLYLWRFCFIKDFGAEQSIHLYSEPPNLIGFDALTQDTDSGIWAMRVTSLIANEHSFAMADHSEIRLYPNCGDSSGTTVQSESDPCEFVYFYDATRIEYTEIEQWNGHKFSPKIEEMHKYLSLKSGARQKRFELGIIINPFLGKNATIHINFDLETNDWKNVYFLPQTTEIQTKVLFTDNTNAPLILVAPDLSNAKDEIRMGSLHCFKIKIKSNANGQSSSTLKFSDTIYVRPIILATTKTVKQWRAKGYELENECTDGYELQTTNAEQRQLRLPGLMHFSFSDAQNGESLKYGSFCVHFKLFGEFSIFYEIGSDHWYDRDNYLVSFDDRLTSLGSSKTHNRINANKALDALKSFYYKCYQSMDSASESLSNIESVYFKQNSYLKPRNKFSSRLREFPTPKIEVSEPGAVAFEIRQFPKPLKLGESTDWIKVHISRQPFFGTFIVKPVCKTEAKLRFEFESNAKDFYELEPMTQAKNAKIEPFHFRLKITAPKDLQCFGHFPYRIEWIVKVSMVSNSETEKTDSVNKPPSIYLMVIASEFDSLNVHDTIEHKGNGVFEDGMSDPKCIEKYRQREQTQADLGPNGPNGQLAPPLDNMGKKSENGWMGDGGDNYDAQTFLKPVTVGDTIRNPAQLADYLKDYDRLKKYVCDSQPKHELCGVNGTNVESDSLGKTNANIPSLSPTNPSPKPLKLWAWQNIVVYVSCALIVIGLVRALGCCEKSLQTKIVEAQMRAMQPLNQMPND